MPLKIEIDWDRVKRELLKKERISGAVKKAAYECLKEAAHLSSPRAVSVRKNAFVKLPAKNLSRALKGSKSFHIFLVTVGARLEDEASRLMKEGEELRGYLLDRIGSFAVESLAENFEAYLSRLYKPKGLSVSARFSPGYCDWPIEEQFRLAKIIPFSRIGVRLTKSCMMVPRKSISGVIAIGPKGLFSKKNSQCGMCDKKDCDYRRIR